MESAIGSCAPTMGLMNLKMIGHKWSRGMQPQLQFYYRLPSSAYLMVGKERPKRSNYKVCSALQAVSPVQYTENPEQTSLCFEDFHVSVCAKEDRVIKICVNASSAMTESIFEKVFAKHVIAAQPLPGFRRMKGGKTPDIPKDVLLHLIGPSKVKKETIKKIINCTVAEYLQKEGLNASKNLKVQQSYEELEAAFELGKEFCFDAVVHLQ